MVIVGVVWAIGVVGVVWGIGVIEGVVRVIRVILTTWVFRVIRVTTLFGRSGIEVVRVIERAVTCAGLQSPSSPSFSESAAENAGTELRRSDRLGSSACLVSLCFCNMPTVNDCWRASRVGKVGAGRAEAASAGAPCEL